MLATGEKTKVYHLPQQPCCQKNILVQAKAGAEGTPGRQREERKKEKSLNCKFEAHYFLRVRKKYRGVDLLILESVTPTQLYLHPKKRCETLVKLVVR